jgi:voltage-gated sodium channel
MLFRENDPWHWRNLHHTMFTLFRCATLEDWTDAMLINMYGCDKYGCDADGMGKLFGFKAAALFIGFITLGSNIMLNPLIGVLTMSMFIGELKLTVLDLGGGRSVDTVGQHFGSRGAGHAISLRRCAC